MGKILVDSEVMKAQETQLQALAGELQRVSEQVGKIGSGFTWSMSASGQLKSRMAAASGYLSSLGQKTTALSTAMGESALRYQAAEVSNLSTVDESSAVRQLKKIATQIVKGVATGMGAVAPDIAGIGAMVGAAGAAGSLWSNFWNGKLKVIAEGAVWSASAEDGESWVKLLSGEASASVKPEYGSYEDKERIYKYEDKEKTQVKDIGDDESWYDKKGTILEGKAEAKTEGSVASARAGISGEYGHLSANVDALTGEAHAEASAGLYVYDKDGKRLFSPGVAAEVGVGVAAFSMGVDGRIGLGEDNNMLGIYGKGDVDVLAAEAKAGVSLNAKEIHVEAKAEAVLAKAEGSAGVSVLGADIGVKGSVQVGVGAHAEVGWTDGVFKLDVGASLGVGVSVGIEVDVGGMVDAVCDGAQAVWEDAKGVWNFIFG